MNQLRRIAIWVNETESGAFRWVLTEVDNERQLSDLRSSEHEFLTFEGALKEGVDALKSLSNDLNAGPRQEIEDEDADPVG